LRSFYFAQLFEGSKEIESSKILNLKIAYFFVSGSKTADKKSKGSQGCVSIRIFSVVLMGAYHNC